MQKKLTRSNKNKKICGVCGGIAEYFDFDPTVIRLIWAIAACFWGTGLLAYFIAALVMPNSPEE